MKYCQVSFKNSTMEKTCAASLRRFFHLFPEQRSKLSFNSLGSQLRREGGIPEVHESSVPSWRHTQRHHGSSSQRLFIALEPRPMPSSIGPITDGDGIGEGVVFICGKHGGNIFRCVLPRVGKWQAVPQIVEIFSLSSAAARSFASDSCHFLKIQFIASSRLCKRPFRCANQMVVLLTGFL